MFIMGGVSDTLECATDDGGEKQVAVSTAATTASEEMGLRSEPAFIDMNIDQAYSTPQEVKMGLRSEPAFKEALDINQAYSTPQEVNYQQQEQFTEYQNALEMIGAKNAEIQQMQRHLNILLDENNLLQLELQDVEKTSTAKISKLSHELASMEKSNIDLKNRLNVVRAIAEELRRQLPTSGDNAGIKIALAKLDQAAVKWNPAPSNEAANVVNFGNCNDIGVEGSQPVNLQDSDEKLTTDDFAAFADFAANVLEFATGSNAFAVSAIDKCAAPAPTDEVDPLASKVELDALAPVVELDALAPIDNLDALAPFHDLIDGLATSPGAIGEKLKIHENVTSEEQDCKMVTIQQAVVEFKNKIPDEKIPPRRSRRKCATNSCCELKLELDSIPNPTVSARSPLKLELDSIHNPTVSARSPTPPPPNLELMVEAVASANNTIIHTVDTSKQNGLHCICGVRFQNRKRLDRHVSQTTNGWSFKCTKCGEAFKTRRELFFHQHEAHNSGPLSRNGFVVKRKTQTQPPIHLHLVTPKTEAQPPIHLVTPKTEAQPPIHLVTPKTEAQPLDHLLTTQKTQQRSLLPKQKTQNRSRLLKQKTQKPQRSKLGGKGIKHGVAKSKNEIKCLCGQIFKKQVTLSEHLRLKIGKRVFKCESCPESFSRYDYFKQHLRRAHKETCEGMGCRECGARGFMTHIELREHRRTSHSPASGVEQK